LEVWHLLLIFVEDENKSIHGNINLYWVYLVVFAGYNMGVCDQRMKNLFKNK
jgi:hypothetical protein